MLTAFDPRANAYSPGGNGAPAAAAVRVHRVVIDSRERDLRAYPNPAQYEVQLAEELRNVVSVRLSSSDVPFPARLIGPRANTLPFLWYGAGPAVQLNAVLRVGDYASGSVLAFELQRALNLAVQGAGGAGTEFFVSLDGLTDALTITAAAQFEILPLATVTGRPMALARVLGLPHTQPVLAVLDPAPADPARPYVTSLPYRVCLERDR